MPTPLFIVGMAAACVLSYLFGSLNSAIIAHRLLYKTDIRTLGSGNAGLTNFHRSAGGKATFLVLAGDILKCAAPVLLSRLLLGDLGALASGMCVIIGHMYPVFFGFKGGKGVLTAVTLVLILNPLCGLTALAVFALIVLITRYVSLASIVGVAVFGVMFHFISDNIIYSAFGFIIAFLIIFSHRANIVRLIRGEENKFSFKRKPGKDGL